MSWDGRSFAIPMDAEFALPGGNLAKFQAPFLKCPNCKFTRKLPESKPYTGYYCEKCNTELEYNKGNTSGLMKLKGRTVEEIEQEVSSKLEQTRQSEA